MRRLSLALLAGTSIASFATMAAAAGPDVFVGIGAGAGQASYNDEDPVDYGLITGFASGEYNFTPMMGGQVDVVGVVQQFNADDEYKYTEIDGAAHLFYRDPMKFLVGGFAQIGNHHESDSGKYSADYGRTFIGAEGQAFLDKVTLYGQVGVVLADFSDNDSGPTVNARGFFATGEFRYFLTPNFKIDVHGGLSKLTPEDVSGSDLSTVNYNFGGGVEYRFDDSPLSLFAKADAIWADGTFDNTSTDFRILVGIKGSFGTDTLFDRDRNGASLKPVLPDLASFDPYVVR